jgi:spore coat protein U-like protein
MLARALLSSHQAKLIPSEVDMSRIGRTAGAIAFAVVMALPSGAPAQTATAQLQVLTTVVKRCTISTTDVSFGSYDPVTANATAPLDGAGSLVVACTQGTAAVIGLDVGSNPTGQTRRMSGGTTFLTYELYKDAGRTQVWTGTGTGQMTLTAAPSIAPRTYQVYGRVPQAQDVAAGSYTDRAVATVNF